MASISELIVKAYHNDDGIFIRQDVIGELVHCSECKFNRGSTPCLIHIRGVDWCSLGKRYAKKEE